MAKAKSMSKGYKGVGGKMPTQLPKVVMRMKNTFTNPSPKSRKVTSARGY
jgi:hypothetical protein